jgi:hypothetical protein
MATADLITSFLNNEMHPDQEREFLLSVAASDSMRLELKSHVMLDRILDSQARRAMVSSDVRSLIFAEAGLVTAEHDGRLPVAGVPVATSSSTFFSRLTRGVLVLVLAATGFAAGYFMGAEDESGLSAQQTAQLPMLNEEPATFPLTVVPVPVLGLSELTQPSDEPSVSQPPVHAAADRSSARHEEPSSTTTRTTSDNGSGTSTAQIDPAGTQSNAADDPGSTPNVDGRTANQVDVDVQAKIRKPDQTQIKDNE